MLNKPKARYVVDMMGGRLDCEGSKLRGDVPLSRLSPQPPEPRIVQLHNLGSGHTSPSLQSRRKFIARTINRTLKVILSAFVAAPTTFDQDRDHSL